MIIFETGLDLKIFVIPLLLRVTSGVPKSILWTKIFPVMLYSRQFNKFAYLDPERFQISSS